jgi:hypothetical protein
MVRGPDLEGFWLKALKKCPLPVSYLNFQLKLTDAPALKALALYIPFKRAVKLESFMG